PGMDNLEATDESSFSVDEVSNNHQGERWKTSSARAQYSRTNKVGQWTSSVIEQCVNQLTRRWASRSKYIVTCLVMQKNGGRPEHSLLLLPYWRDTRRTGPASSNGRTSRYSHFNAQNLLGSFKMAADAVGDDFCLRGLKTELRQPPAPERLERQTPQASHNPRDLQQHRLSNQRSPKKTGYLKAPRYLVTVNTPVNRLDGLPERPVARLTSDVRASLGGLLAASDISRDRCSDRQGPQPGAGLRWSAAGAGPGLPTRRNPWRLRLRTTQTTSSRLSAPFGDHLADALPAARQQRQLLMAETAPGTVFVSSPYSVELARLRMQRLRIEEELLLEVKRQQQQLERRHPPKRKWFELRTPQFHYEATRTTSWCGAAPSCRNSTTSCWSSGGSCEQLGEVQRDIRCVREAPGR
uniref:Family with sequence similarity 161, member A n=1 Tax=Macrostomum lignano TaxID=282301 RepID=A0A1I8FBM9_9PLAT